MKAAAVFLSLLLVGCSAHDEERLLSARRELKMAFPHSGSMEGPISRARLADVVREWKDREEVIRSVRESDFVFVVEEAAIFPSIISHSDGRRIEKSEPASCLAIIRGGKFIEGYLWTVPQKPNQAPEPTPPSVTIRAFARLAPAGVVAHL